MYIDFRKYLDMKIIQKASFQTLRVSVKVQEAIQELQEKFEFPNTTCIG